MAPSILLQAWVFQMQAVERPFILQRELRNTKSVMLPIMFSGNDINSLRGRINFNLDGHIPEKIVAVI